MLSSGASKFALFILAIELLLLGPVKGHAEPTTEPPLVSSSLFLLGDAPQAPAQKFSTFNTLSLTRLNVPSNNTGGWSIDTADRQLVRSFYNSVYQASEDTPIDWSGDQSTCSAGDTSNDFKNAVLARINFFRAMAGVPANITLNANYSAKSQQAALMMSANNSLNHYPPNSWNCYTADGYEAAGNSNLSLGRNGWDAVAGQMQDNGANNTATGHRKWILWPQTQSMGTGDVAAANGGYPATNSLWVFDGNTFATMPATRDDFVAWPAKGFNPYHIVPIRWSFTYQNADFASATVSVTQDGNTLPVSIDHTENGTFGSIVWRINNMTANSDWPKPTADTIYIVNISNVLINATPTSFNYSVTLIDPQTALAGEENAIISGNSTPTEGVLATYSFTPISFTQNHQAQVSQITDTSDIYDAEDNGSSTIDGTDASYDLIFSGSGSNGTNVYRLAPATPSESVEFMATYITSASSTIQFDSKLGYATNEQTAAVQISADGGNSWKDIYSLTGNNAQMETSFSNHNISLSAYVDKFVKFRALYRHDGFHYTGTEANVSFLIDNVTLTDAKSVVNSSLIDINATNSFSFTPASGKQYALAVRAIPWDGYPGTDWGPIFYATASAQDDNDGDGEPDSSDTDDDNDGVPDISDAYPLISLDGRVDTDNDGAPDNCDSACLATGMLADTDDDGDGFTDQEEIEAGTSPTDPNNYPKGSTILKILPLLLNQE